MIFMCRAKCVVFRRIFVVFLRCVLKKAISYDIMIDIRKR